MTAGSALRAPRVAPDSQYGPVINNADGLAEITRLCGGSGRAFWKMMAFGSHLAGGWGTAEYVVLPPGSSCGEHLHAAREEIYYILSGSAVMTVNGEEVPVTAGDLVTAPLGTRHGIAVPPGEPGEMSFFVVEMAPGTRPALSGAEPERIAAASRLAPATGWRGGGHGQDILVAQVDLTRYLDGPWLRFTVIDIPPGDTLGPYELHRDANEVLFVADGEAALTVGGTAARGGKGLCAATGTAAAVTVRNLSGDLPLRVISTEGTA